MPHDPDRIIVLMQVPTETEAAVIVACLEEQGVQAHVTGALTSGFRAEAPVSGDSDRHQSLLFKVTKLRHCLILSTIRIRSTREPEPRCEPPLTVPRADRSRSLLDSGKGKTPGVT